jgi:hypothetical protein
MPAKYRAERQTESGTRTGPRAGALRLRNDARYDRWAPRRSGLGVQFPIGPHVVVEPHYLRQNAGSNPPCPDIFGFKINLYF